MPTDSGRPHRIFRCPECQTAVWSEYGGNAPLRFVRVGTLDDRHTIAPSVRVVVEALLALLLWATRLGWDLGLGGAVAVACLTVYDMAKAVDRGMVIEDVRLVSKSKQPAHDS